MGCCSPPQKKKISKDVTYVRFPVLQTIGKSSYTIHIVQQLLRHSCTYVSEAVLIGLSGNMHYMYVKLTLSGIQTSVGTSVLHDQYRRGTGICAGIAC